MWRCGPQGRELPWAETLFSLPPNLPFSHYLSQIDSSETPFDYLSFHSLPFISLSLSTSASVSTNSCSRISGVSPTVHPVVIPLPEDELVQKIEQELRRSVVVLTNFEMTLSDVMAGVQHYFAASATPFTVRDIGKFRFVIEGSESWKQERFEQGFVQIGREEHEVRDLDPDYIELWIRVVGVPYGWMSSLQRVVLFGAIVDIDKFTANRMDLRFARVKVQAKCRELIPPDLTFEVQRKNGNLDLVDIKYIVEADQPQPSLFAQEIMNLPEFSWHPREYAAALGRLWHGPAGQVNPSGTYHFPSGTAVEGGQPVTMGQPG